MHHLHDAVIEKQTIELGGTEAQYLGHGLTLIGCRIVFRVSASALTVAKTRFIDCDLEVKKKLVNFRWLHAQFEGCRFSGTLSGCDFGHWPEAFGPDGAIANCDLRSATLDGCRFIGCDPRTLQFPRWPCFTIVEPGRRKEELAAVRWPGRVGMMVSFDSDPTNTAAVTFSADVLSKKYGATVDEIRAVVAALPDVVF
jgi:hypothetical protein